MPAVKKRVTAIAFPYRKNGRVLNVKYRTREKNFCQEKGAKKILYGLDDLKNTDTAIITEGEIDKLSFDEIGYTFAVSVPDGAPSPGSKNYSSKFSYLDNCQKQLNHIEKFIIAADNDNPGLKLGRELARRLGYDKCYTVKYPKDCKDANDVLVNHGKGALINLIGQAKPYPLYGVLRVNDISDDLLYYHKNGIQNIFSTGWSNLDQYYRVRPGELTIITGYTSHGKSEFLDALMVNMIAKHQWQFGICSLENIPHRIHLVKLIEKFSGIPMSELSDSMISSEINKINDYVYFINPPDDNFNINNVLSIARSLVYRYGINGLILDPFNEFEHLRSPHISETEYIGRFLSKLRRFAKSNQIHIWIVAHPVKAAMTGEGKTRIPNLYSISGSANWANKADNGLVVFRHREDNKVEIHIPKIRFKDVGKVGQTDLFYNSKSGCYHEQQTKF